MEFQTKNAIATAMIQKISDSGLFPAKYISGPAPYIDAPVPLDEYLRAAEDMKNGKGGRSK